MFSPTFLTNSIRFKVGMSPYLNLMSSLVDMLNCFQNTMMPLTDPVCMNIPSCNRERFSNIKPNITMSDYELLLVQLFNAFKGGVDTRMLWNEHFDRFLSILDVHRSMRDLSVFARIMCIDLVIMLFFVDDFIISNESEKICSKFVNHLT